MKIETIEKELKNEFDALVNENISKLIKSAKEEFKKEEEAAKILIKDFKKAEKLKEEIEENIEEVSELVDSFKAQIKKYVSDLINAEVKRLNEETKLDNDKFAAAIAELQKTVNSIKPLTINNAKFVKKYNK